MMTPAIADTSGNYGSKFLYSLIAVSLLPIIVAVVNFKVLRGADYGVAMIYGFFSITSGAHVFMNWSYFVSPRWRRYFAQRPFHFYVAPLLIVLSTTFLLAQPNKTIGLATLYAAGFVNIWHHSKQNWGVMAIVGRIRGRNVSPLMKPLCRAWGFFAIPLCLQFPEVVARVGHAVIYDISLLCLIGFVIYCIYSISRTGFAFRQDPIVLLAAIALCCYFVPIISFQAVPWAVSIWALAHAGQYYLIVFSSLSLNSRKKKNKMLLNMIFAFSIMAALTGLAFLTMKTGYNQWNNVWLRAVFGVYLGVSLMHFWVDAFIWKFHNPDIRKLHGEAFAF